MPRFYLIASPFPSFRLLLVGCTLFLAACETVGPRDEGANSGLAREMEDHKVKRITPENLLTAAGWAGDSLTRSAERELRENDLPLDSFRIKRLPATAVLATVLGATMAVVPAARAADGARISRPTQETFAYVKPAGPGKVWRAYFTRKGIAELYTQRTRPKTRAEKRAPFAAESLAPGTKR